MRLFEAFVVFLAIVSLAKGVPLTTGQAQSFKDTFSIAALQYINGFRIQHQSPALQISIGDVIGQSWANTLAINNSGKARVQSGQEKWQIVYASRLKITNPTNIDNSTVNGKRFCFFENVHKCYYTYN